MRLRLVISGVLLTWFFLDASLVEAVQVADDLFVGVAVVDVTPKEPIRLHGFGFRRTESEGVRQPIFAKALAFGREQKDAAVLIAVDNLGVSDELVREVGRRLQMKVGLDPLHLTVTATHTHTGPMLSGVAPTIFGMPIIQKEQERIDRYTRNFTDKLADVALAALKDRKAAKVTWGIGKADLAVNRRTPKGPVDHDLPVLVVKDADDKVRAILFNYACHCVTLSDNKISGDWAGYAQAHIERLFPGAIALCSIGCGADANPRSGVTKDKGEIADQQGAEIATEVQRLLRGHLRSVAGPISIRHERIDLAFDRLPTREQWEAKAKQKDAVGHHARVNLARLDRGEALPVKFSYPIQTWTFGETLAMVNLPGEVVADYALRLKSELDGRRLWVNAYANAAPCYIPSEKVLKEGGYEGGGAMVYYDLPTRLAPGLEQQIVDAVHRQADKAFKAPVDPKKTQGARPLAPEQSLASMKVRPGLAVELMAAEPLVTSPVAIAFGPEGKLWVAEMYDYPLGLDGKYQPGGRIIALTSTKGDLPFDKATVFLDNIPFPTGVTVWRKGVLVCAAPDILYAEDSDGDGKADIVKTLFSGFGAHNYQARVNSLEYGLDGWVYGSCGIFGGKIKSFNGKTYDLGDRDFRIKPDTGELEPATGRTQQGRVRDDWGNWFGCDNSNICWHYPLADYYLRRNTHLIPPPAAVTVSEGDGNRLYPFADNLQLFKLSGPPGRATAACGLGIYRDDLLGEEFRGNTFTCEPVNRLVTRRVLSPKGSTFVGRRADDERQAEFLTAADPWFRPVQARTGPDGCLWIVDMHRAVIEHPRWIPPDELAKLDVRAGFDMGRIYRVRPAKEAPRSPQRLDNLATADLVRALDSSNGCRRDLAHQMLIWRNETTSLAALANLFSTVQRPEGRLHALCAHREMSPLPRSLLETASVDKHPGVRRWAVHFSESLLKNARYDDKSDLPMATPLSDADPQVRLEAAYLLAASDRPALAGRALAGVVLRHADDAYFTAAALSSLTRENASAFVHGLVDGQPAMNLPGANMQKIVSAAIGVADRSSLTAIFDTLLISSSTKEPSSYAVLGAFMEALERRAVKLDQIADGASMRKWTSIEQRARAIAAGPKEAEEARALALSVLGLSSEQKDSDRKLFANLLSPQAGPRLQTAALGRLSGLGDEAAAGAMIAGWKSHSPALRGQVLDALLSRPAWQKLTLGAIDKKVIPANDIDAARRERLLNHRDASFRQQAAKAFAGALNTDRQKVLDSHRDVLKMAGDFLRGKAVFAQHCAACHAVDGVGHSVGPDLAALAGKSPEYFLQEILDPSRNLDSRYVQYLAVTKNGQVFSGLMASESAVSITLKGPDGKESSVLRADLEELTTAGKSLMPDGLEMNLTKQALADLLTYLTSPRTTRLSTVERQILALSRPNADASVPDGETDLRQSRLVVMRPLLQMRRSPEWRSLAWILA